MKTKPLSPAPSGAKASCRQIYFWAAIASVAAATIGLAGASDGASQPDFDDTPNASYFWTNNEHFYVHNPKVLLDFNKQKVFFSDKSFHDSLQLPGANNFTPGNLFQGSGKQWIYFFRERKKSLLESFLYYSIKVVGFLIRLLPVNVALAIGRVMGSLAYCFDVRHKYQVYVNLKIAFAGANTGQGTG